MGRVLVKPGVAFTVVAPAGFRILEALKATARTLDLDLTITSACDGVHSGPSDPHYTGQAYDVRSHDLAPDLRPKVIDALLTELGREKFSGFLEVPGTSGEHFHVQRKVGTTFSIEDYLAT